MGDAADDAERRALEEMEEQGLVPGQSTIVDSDEFGIAWDYDPDNPNPHAWYLEPERYPTEEAAVLDAEMALADDGHISEQGYLICRIT